MVLLNLSFNIIIRYKNKTSFVDLFYRLLSDSNEIIQEQTLNLLRNIGCGRQENIEEVFNGFEEGQFINILEIKVQMANHQIVLQTLYILVNVATGNELHKSRIMESTILIKSIVTYLVKIIIQFSKIVNFNFRPMIILKFD